MTLGADGSMKWVQTRNKSFGSADVPKAQEIREVRRGHLSEIELRTIVDQFRNWDEVKTQPPREFADGPSYEISYGRDAIAGGDGEIATLWGTLNELGAKMPMAK
jgi:hypothetical protein